MKGVKGVKPAFTFSFLGKSKSGTSITVEAPLFNISTRQPVNLLTYLLHHFPRTHLVSGSQLQHIGTCWQILQAYLLARGAWA
jgi:hypothetical protein